MRRTISLALICLAIPGCAGIKDGDNVVIQCSAPIKYAGKYIDLVRLSSERFVGKGTAEEILYVESGATAHIIKIEGHRTYLRLLDGEYKGRKGWVATKDLKAK